MGRIQILRKKERKKEREIEMHETVLIIGASNREEIEKALYPFYQLGCSMKQDEIKIDSRSDFIERESKEEAQKHYNELMEEKPTKEQISFFQKNFTKESNEEECKRYYSEKNKVELYCSPCSYIGNDYAYGIAQVSDKEHKFLFIPEEKMSEALRWQKKYKIVFSSVLYGNSKEEFIRKYPTIDVFMEEQEGYEWNEEKQKYGYWDNPYGFWDWYQIGGRWLGFFTKKEDTKESYVGDPSWRIKIEEGDIEELKKRSDVIKIGDIDFEQMEEENKKYYRELWEKTWDLRKDVYLLGGKTSEELDKTVRRIVGANEGETKEDFIEKNKYFSTSVVLYRGDWYEVNNEGIYISLGPHYKGDTINKKLPFFLQGLDKNIFVALIDCHR